MKKSLCLTLSILFAASLCACGAKKETPVPEVSETSSIETEASVSQETSVEEALIEEALENSSETEQVMEHEAPEVEEVKEETHVIEFADKLEFAQVGVPQTIHLCQYNVDDNGNYIQFSDAVFESQFTLLNLFASEQEDTIIYEIMFKYDLDNWDYDHDKFGSWMNIFDLDTECEVDADAEDSLVKWHYDLGEDEEGNCADYFVIEAPKDMHLGFYLCANIHEDDYAIEKFEGMGPEISWAIAHFKSAFIDLNPELINQ